MDQTVAVVGKLNQEAVQARFYQELGRVPVRWMLLIGGSIRGFLNEVRVCPIVAVCNWKYGMAYGPGDWEKAAKKLGLDPQFSAKVAVASDNEYGDRNFRGVLLAATKLAEKTR